MKDRKFDKNVEQEIKKLLRTAKECISVVHDNTQERLVHALDSLSKAAYFQTANIPTQTSAKMKAIDDQHMTTFQELSTRLEGTEFFEIELRLKMTKLGL